MITQPPTVLTAGEWYWIDCGEDGDGDPALGVDCGKSGNGWEIRAGNVNAAYLRQLALDLMKLANLVAQHQQGMP
jgi:hypothetical protein